MDEEERNRLGEAYDAGAARARAVAEIEGRRPTPPAGAAELVVLRARQATLINGTFEDGVLAAEAYPGDRRAQAAYRLGLQATLADLLDVEGGVRLDRERAVWDVVDGLYDFG